MKKRTIVALIAVGTVIGAQAAVIDFGKAANSGDNWTNLTQVVEANGSITYTKVQDGVTFNLNVAGVTDYTGTPTDQAVQNFLNGAGVGIVGNQNNGRISNGLLDTTVDDEYFVFTLGVTPGTLSALSLDHVQMRYDTQADDQLNWVDQNGTAVNAVGLGAGYNYTSIGGGLEALSLANLGSWSLAAGSVDHAGSPTGTDKGIMALGQVSFEYTVIPEPATMSLIGLFGGAMVWMRRKFAA
jgi:hypothetical protein